MPLALAAALPLLLAAATPPRAAPAVVLAPPAARPGDAVLVEVEAAGGQAPSGTLAGRPLTFWRAGDRWLAVAGLPIETPPGDLRATLDADGVPLEGDLRIVEPGFASHALSLPPAYVEPPAAVKARMEADRRAFAEAFDRPFSPPLFTKDFALPRDAGTSGRYGDQRTLNGKVASVHYGLDLRGPRGAPIHAANDGTVALVRDAYMSGKTVVLWHGAGIFTVYFHLDRIDVRAGDRVRRGQRIGLLGSTGRSTGPHLHFGAKVNDLYVDPESLLAIDFAHGTAPARVAAAPARAAPASPVPEPAPAEAPPRTAPDAPHPPPAAPEAVGGPR